MRLKTLHHLSWKKESAGRNPCLYTLMAGEVDTQIYARIEKSSGGYQTSLGVGALGGRPQNVVAEWVRDKAGYETTACEGVVMHTAPKSLEEAKMSASIFVLEHRIHLEIMIADLLAARFAELVVEQKKMAILGLYLGEADGPSYTPDNYRQGIWVDKLEDAPAGLREFNRSHRRSS